MFDKSLFLKSLPKIDVTDRNGRDFLDRHKPKFKPTKEKEVTLYNDETVCSKYNQSLKFTNFVSDKTNGSILNRLEQLSADLSLIRRTESFDPVNFNTDRIAEIIKLYLNNFTPKDLEEDQIMKVSLYDSFGKKEGVRVYFLLNNKLNAYEIILIDVFHLVIPSAHNDKKGKRVKKDKMLNMTFEQNRNNKKCISEYFHLVN